MRTPRVVSGGRREGITRNGVGISGSGRLLRAGLIAALVAALALAGPMPATGSVAPGDGYVVAWGADNSPLKYLALNVSGVTIAAGYSHGLALQGDGTVLGWGYNSHGQAQVPYGLSEVTAVAAGNHHSLALKNDGTVVGWGSNLDGGQASVPADLSGATAIAAGDDHSLALKNDGTVVAWGNNGYGQADVPADLSGVTAIAAGSGYSLALKGDGTVVAWGNNDFRQTDVPADLSGVTAIATGPTTSLALKDDGTVVGWGRIHYGQTDVLAHLSGVTAIAVGHDHSLALKNDGTVVAWGINELQRPLVPEDVPAGLSGVTAIAAGMNVSVALVVRGTDSSSPNITPSVVGTTGDNDWYTSAVAVSWTVTDNESAISAKTGCDPTTVTADTTGVTLTCTATSSGGTASGSVTIARDGTGPVLSWSSPDPADGREYDFATLPAAPTCTAADDTSGVSAAGCTVTGYATTVGEHTLTATARDNAGNITTAARTYTVRSNTAPAVTLTPTSLSFGQVPVGDSAEQIVALRNTGTGVLTVTGLSSSNPAVSVVNADPPFTVAPGGVTPLTVSFEPRVVGAVAATLTVTDDAPGSPQEISVTGSGLAQADLAVAIGSSPTRANAKSPLTYTIRIDNNGPNDAKKVRVVDALPATVTFSKLFAPAGVTCTKPPVGMTGTVVCTRTTLAASSPITITIVTKVTARARWSITNSAVVSSATADPLAASNTATVTNSVHGKR